MPPMQKRNSVMFYDDSMPGWLMAIIAICVVVVVLALAAIIFNTGPLHAQDVKTFNGQVAKVERFCGRKAAVAFKATHDDSDDNQGAMQEWVRRCTIGR